MGGVGRLEQKADRADHGAPERERILKMQPEGEVTETAARTCVSQKKKDVGKCLLVALNAKYSHTGLAVRYLRESLAAHGIRAAILERTINEEPREVLESILRERPDWVLFSCYIWNWELVCRLGEMVRTVLPDIRMVLGGPEVSHEGFCPPDWVWAVAQGEGEALLPRVLLEHGSAEDDLASGFVGHGSAEGALAFQLVGQGTRLYGAGSHIDLDALPFPYPDLEGLRERTLYYESSRGCPFCCAYCLSGHRREKVRYRSLELVCRDLQRFLDAGVRQVKFVDRTFNSAPKRAAAIWKYLVEKDNGVLNVQFEVAGDLLTSEQVDVLSKARAGLFQLEIGVQSVCGDTLQKVCRKTNLKRLEQSVRQVLAKGNVHCHLDLIAGLPGEGLEDTLRGCGVLLDWDAHQIQLGLLKVLSGAPLGERAQMMGLRYNPRPPYDVLQTPDIDFIGLHRLEGLAKCIDVYWNSGRFRESIRYLLAANNESGDDAYVQRGRLLLSLWESRTKAVLGKYEQYDWLYDYAKEELNWEQAALERLRYLLRWDLCRHERPKKLPVRVPEGRRALRRELPEWVSSEVYGEWWPLGYLPGETEINRGPDDGGSRLCLFDYRQRDLRGRAKVMVLPPEA